MHSPRRVDEQAARVLDSLRRIVRALRTSSHALSPVGGPGPRSRSALAGEHKSNLGGAQLFVLSQLAEEPGISIKRLSERTLTDPSSVSVVVARLIERKLIARKRDPKDARRSVLTVTPRGLAQLSRAPEPFQVQLVSALLSLPRTRLAQLDASLAEIVSATGLSQGVAPMFFEEPTVRRSRRGA
jgi:DNA-binding MarR family transcriptional regulator